MGICPVLDLICDFKIQILTRKFSFTASSVSLRPLVLELSAGEFNAPPPPACGGWRNTPATAGFNKACEEHWQPQREVRGQAPLDPIVNITPIVVHDKE